MESEFIPYNLALRLKELGFDEPCLAYFKIEYNALNKKHFGCLSFPKDIKDLESQKKMTYCIGQMTLLAPTWQSAFEWFREKYNIEINICKGFYDIPKNGFFFSKHDYYILDLFTFEEDYCEENAFKYSNYQSAKENSLLKMCEIVESRNEINEKNNK